MNFHLLQMKKMSCDLLEHAKQGYKTSNGITTLEPPNSMLEMSAVPKTLENNTLEQVFLSYTNVSSFFVYFFLSLFTFFLFNVLAPVGLTLIFHCILFLN